MILGIPTAQLIGSRQRQWFSLLIVVAVTTVVVPAVVLGDGDVGGGSLPNAGEDVVVSQSQLRRARRAYKRSSEVKQLYPQIRKTRNRHRRLNDWENSGEKVTNSMPMPKTTSSVTTAYGYGSKPKPVPRPDKVSNVLPTMPELEEDRPRIRPDSNSMKSADSMNPPDPKPDSFKSADSMNPPDPKPDSFKSPDGMNRPDPKPDSFKSADSMNRPDPKPDSFKSPDAMDKPGDSAMDMRAMPKNANGMPYKQTDDYENDETTMMKKPDAMPYKQTDDYENDETTMMKKPDAMPYKQTDDYENDGTTMMKKPDVMTNKASDDWEWKVSNGMPIMSNSGKSDDDVELHSDSMDEQNFQTRENDLEKSANFINVNLGPSTTNGNSDGYHRGSNGGNWNGQGSWSGGDTGMTRWELTRMKDYMALADVTHDKLPFGIENGAPDFSVFISSQGNVGLGTSYPAANIHIAGTAPFIRFEDGFTASGNSQTYDEQVWDMSGSGAGFYIYEETRAYRNMPFKIAAGAKTMSIVVASNGNVGLGTDAPAAKLHVVGGARIDGPLQVGSCLLDTNTCQFRRSNNGRGFRGRSVMETSSEEVEDNDAYVASLESRLQVLEDRLVQQETRFEAMFRAMELEIAALKDISAEVPV